MRVFCMCQSLLCFFLCTIFASEPKPEWRTLETSGWICLSGRGAVFSNPAELDAAFRNPPSIKFEEDALRAGKTDRFYCQMVNVDYPRSDWPVEIIIPSDGKQFPVSITEGVKRLPFQIEDAEPGTIRLVWMAEGDTPANTTRTFEIALGNKDVEPVPGTGLFCDQLASQVTTNDMEFQLPATEPNIRFPDSTSYIIQSDAGNLQWRRLGDVKSQQWHMCCGFMKFLYTGPVRAVMQTEMTEPNTGIRREKTYYVYYKGARYYFETRYLAPPEIEIEKAESGRAIFYHKTPFELFYPSKTGVIQQALPKNESETINPAQDWIYLHNQEVGFMVSIVHSWLPKTYTLYNRVAVWSMTP